MSRGPVVGRVLETEHIRGPFYLLRLQAPHIAGPCVPGQFVMLRLAGPGWPYLNRPFSIYDSDGDSVIEILYKVVGRATSVLSGAVKGDRIYVIGPLGKGFSPADDCSHVVAVAGGTGLPPLAFYCRRYAGVCDEMTLVAGATTADELLVPVGLMAQGIEVRPYTEDGTRGTRGLATDGLREVLGGRPGSPSGLRLVACGPRTMLREVHRIAVSANAPCEVGVEEMMACGVGACMSCAVPDSGGGYFHACKDGPVVDSRRIDFPRWLGT
jgi:dihydroorotate dehydrogenase electron transfer subunit